MENTNQNDAVFAEICEQITAEGFNQG